MKERIAALRTEHPGQYTNISCLRTNAQKYLPYYFNKGQLTKLFFLFPVCQQPACISMEPLPHASLSEKRHCRIHTSRSLTIAGASLARHC